MLFAPPVLFHVQRAILPHVRVLQWWSREGKRRDLLTYKHTMRKR